ncbi:MAG: hypothetical protein R6T93_13905 [Trueperaceae bacterium]
MLLLSDTLILHHAAAHSERLRAEAALRGDVVAARRVEAAAAGRSRALSSARLRTRLARTLSALAERLEPRSSAPRLDRGNGSAAARG